MLEIKLQFLQVHRIDTETEFCIHREVIKKQNTETKLNMEGNEGKREVMVLCKYNFHVASFQELIF